MKKEIKYKFVDLEDVTIASLKKMFADLEYAGVDDSAQVRTDFGLEPGTYNVEVTEVLDK